MNKQTFAQKSIDFHSQLLPATKLPNSVDWILAYQNEDTLNTFRQFMQKFYNDNQKRYFLFGINPGRFGAGVTGVSFTDPILLENNLGIQNDFEKKHELSALFIHEMMTEFSSAEFFYQHFFITSVNPVGLIKDGKNYNYYDDAETLKTVEPFIIKTVEQQMEFGCHQEKAFCIGQGKNFKIFQKLNKKHKWFHEIEPLPHPRWVMQYRRKTKQVYFDEYVTKLSSVLKQGKVSI